MKPRLLIVLSDSLAAYDKKGYSREERNKYFNPDGKFELCLLGFQEKGESPFDYAGFPIYPFNEDGNVLEEGRELNKLDCFPKVKPVIDLFKPQLVRGYGGSWAGKLAGEIGRYWNIPSVLSVHDRFPTDAIFTTDRVICVSEEVKQKCMDMGLDNEKIRVLLDRVDTNLFQDYRGSQEVRDLEQQYPGRFKTVSAGRLVWEKNLERLVDATQIVRDVVGDYTHLHFGCFGDDKEKIKSKVRGLNHFKLLPNLPQTKLAKYFSWADAFVMASLSEGFGMVYIEALSTGTPVITSNKPPLNSYVIDNYNGLLVNPESHTDIAGKTISLLSVPGLKEKLKRNARLSIIKFDSVKQQKREVEIYMELLNELKISKC